MIYVYIGLGGAIGACLRYFLTQECTKLLGKGFPFGTLAVNVVGSFLLGYLYSWLSAQTNVSDNLKVFVGVGLLGALTTFSTFSYDTFLLLQQGDGLKAVVNIFANVSVCLIGVYLAYLLVRG